MARDNDSYVGWPVQRVELWRDRRDQLVCELQEQPAPRMRWRGRATGKGDNLPEALRNLAEAIDEDARTADRILISLGRMVPQDESRLRIFIGKVFIGKVSGEEFYITTAIDGGNGWGLGVTFPLLSGAHRVAEAISAAWTVPGRRVEIEEGGR